MKTTILHSQYGSRIATLLAMAGMLLAGCEGMSRGQGTGLGALIGAGGGAAVGGAIGGGKGALIGAGIGALVGAGVGYIAVDSHKRRAEQREIERAKATASANMGVLSDVKQNVPDATAVAVPVDDAKTSFILVDPKTAEPLKGKDGEVQTYTPKDQSQIKKVDDKGNPMASAGEIDGYKVVFPTL